MEILREALPIFVEQFLQWKSLFYISAVILLVVILILYKKSQKKRANLLSTAIKIRKREIGHRHSIKKIVDFFKQSYFPSISSFIFVFLLFLPFFITTLLFSFLLKPEIYSLSKNIPNIQYFITIETGLAFIIFPIIIFIIGLSGKEENTGIKRSEVLLRESYLFPIALFTIVSIVFFVWSRILIANIISIIMTAILSIFAFYRLIRIILIEHLFLKKGISLVRDKIRRNIDLAIEERVGNEILLGKLVKKDFPISFRPFLFDKKSHNYHDFKLHKQGIIKDINMQKLEEFAKTVEKESNKNGYSFYKDKKIIIPENSHEEVELHDEPEKKEFHTDPNRYLLKKFKDQIVDNNNSVLCISKNSIKDKKILRKLGNLVNEIFIVKKDEEFSERIRIELRNIKDQVIQDIKEEKIGRLENFRSIYIALAEEFIESMKDFSGDYSLGKYSDIDSEFFGGRNLEIKWILEDVYDIVEAAFKSRVKKIIVSIASLPISISRRAIDFLDYNIFNKFNHFSLLFYKYAKQEKDPELKEFLIDRSWRHLRETADLFIGYELEKKALKIKTVNKLKDFAIGILFVFQNLLKRAYDDKELEFFKLYISKLNLLFKNFQPSKDYDISDFDPNLPKDPDKFEYQKNLIKVEEEISLRKKQLLFGISSWILNDYRNEQKNKEILEFYNIIYPFFGADLVKFTELFLSCHLHETEDFWQWDIWEIIPEGQVKFIDVHSKLEWFYCIKSLQILSHKNKNEILSTNIPHNRDLIFLAEKEDSPIKNILDEIKKNFVQWENIISKGTKIKIPYFLQILEIAIENQKREEENTVIEKPLSKNRITSFKNEFVMRFNEEATIRKILTKYGGFINKIDTKIESKKLSLWGINQLFDKAAFIDNWYVHYPNMGGDFGRHIATQENDIYLKKIKENLPIFPESIEIDDIISKFKYLINELKQKGIKPSVGLAILNAENFFTLQKYIMPQWDPKCPKVDISGFMGILKFGKILIHLFRFLPYNADNSIFFLEPEKFAHLIQYAPYEKEEDKLHQQDNFYINIHDLNEDNMLLKEIIKANPEWLKEHKEKKDKEHYLKQKVVIKIYEKFKISIKNKDAGYNVLLKSK